MNDDIRGKRVRIYDHYTGRVVAAVVEGGIQTIQVQTDSGEKVWAVRWDILPELESSNATDGHSE